MGHYPPKGRVKAPKPQQAIPATRSSRRGQASPNKSKSVKSPSNKSHSPKPAPKASTNEHVRMPPPRTWAILLRPLNLIDALRLESTCASFAATIYSGQHRFVWNRKFQDYLYDKHNIICSPDNVDKFLVGIAPKIGPHCRQLILKLRYLMSNAVDVLPYFDGLESVYLQTLYYSEEWSYLISLPGLFVSPKLSELRLAVIKKEPNYLPNSLSKFVRHFAPSLVSFEAWRSEMMAGLELLKLSALRQFRLSCTQDMLVIGPDLARIHRQMDKLFVKWDTIDPITVEKMAQFGETMNNFSSLRALSLQLEWLNFRFPNPVEFNKFKLEWRKLYRFKITHETLSKLSVDIQHTNYKSAKNSSEMLADLMEKRNLTLLRVVASMVDVFPIKLTAHQVNTLEIVFKYAKMYREISAFLPPYAIMPDYISNDTFLMDMTRWGKSVGQSIQALKLTHCPMMDDYLAIHIATAFPNLKMFYFRALQSSTYKYSYMYLGVKRDFMRGITMLVHNLPKLQVIKFGDKYPKPDLTDLVKIFLQRALKNLKKQYALYVDRKNVLDGEVLLDSALKVHNLRVF